MEILAIHLPSSFGVVWDGFGVGLGWIWDGLGGLGWFGDGLGVACGWLGGPWAGPWGEVPVGGPLCAVRPGWPWAETKDIPPYYL